MNGLLLKSRVATLVATLSIAFANTAGAQMAGTQSAQPAPSTQPQPSPAATAGVTVAGGTIDVKYSSPRMRGRKVMGDLVPFDKVWRTGANSATTIITSVPLRFGDVLVPAGTHTLYTLPGQNGWQLIINNQTGQWGTEYNQAQDLGRVPMKSKPLTTPQEAMSISFENTTGDATEMHIRWETADQYVTIARP